LREVVGGCERGADLVVLEVERVLVEGGRLGVDDARGELDLAERLHHLDLGLEARGRVDERQPLQPVGGAALLAHLFTERV